MNKSIFCFSALFLAASCSQDKTNGSFELKGTITGSKGETIYLEKLTSPKPVVVDSAVLDNNGEFQFKNYVPKIGFYRLKTDERNMITLVLDSADKVTVTADIKDLEHTGKIKGSADSDLFFEYDALAKERNLQLDSLDKAFQALMAVNKMDSLKMDSLSRLFEAPYNKIMGRFNNKISAKIQENSSSYASLIAVQGMDIDKFADAYLALDKGLSEKYPRDKNVMMFHDVVNKMLSTTVGQRAPEIVLPSPDGKEIALSSLRGKVVLIDFWASWCGPCRKEMPNVVKAYAKYKDKGFEIYGVSLDKENDKWLEAITKDGITWPQVSDLQFWNSSVVKLYGIEGIPYTVLLDKEGNILAKNLRGAELDKKLAEILH